MAIMTFRTFFLCLAICLVLPLGGYAQSNNLVQRHNVIDSEHYTSAIYSAKLPTVIGHPSIGELGFKVETVGQDLYQFNYRPGKNIEAETRAVVEYWIRNTDTGALEPEYTTLIFTISKSLIYTIDDNIFLTKNQRKNDIQVLLNDHGTHEPLTLLGVAYTEGGFASVNNNSIDFMPLPDFTGDAFVYYTVQDSVGKVNTGRLKIIISDPETTEPNGTINIISYGGQAVEIPLPFENFELTGSLQYGSLQKADGSQLYKPTANVTATEQFTLHYNGISRDVTVEMIKKDQQNSWVVDDIVYTSKGTQVTFDTEANDLKKNQILTNFSPQLVQGEKQGVFTYTPESFFIGSKTFQYTLYNGYEEETGNIHVKVNNFYPQTQYSYNFTSLSNSALVIEYKIPISNYTFELVSGPANGSVLINEGTATINMGCVEVSGTNLVIFQPDYNFTGEDSFVLNYCVDGQCTEVEISVSVVENNLDGCQCYTGCVWSGDANNDGLVNVTDLLAMAYSLGASGDESEWNGADGWVGRNTNNWNYYGVSGVNSKYADADGNGIVDELDFDAILDNYDKNHSLVPPQLLDIKSYPFSLKPLQDTFYIGDRIGFEIAVGNDNYPVLDAYGFAYSLGFPAGMVDSSSVSLEYYNNSWLAGDEAVYGISKQIKDGWIETAVSRLKTYPKSGKGVLGKLDFIVEEDLVGGFRVSDGVIPITISIQDGKTVTSDGQMYEVLGAEATVYINISEKQAQNSDQAVLLAYPNPTSDFINFHMNGGHEVLAYEIYDLMGRQVKSRSDLKTRALRINTSDMPNGNYFIRALTTFGPRVAKFEVISQ